MLEEFICMKRIYVISAVIAALVIIGVVYADSSQCTASCTGLGKAACMKYGAGGS